MSRTKSITAGLITGIVGAASAALLAAPKSGKAFRTDMKDKNDEMQASFKQFRADLVVVKNQAMQIKDSIPMIKETSKELKEEIDLWQKEIEPNVKNLQASIGEAQTMAEKLNKAAQK